MKKIALPFILFFTFLAAQEAIAQCGPASIDVTDYCPDQYAEFTVNDADANNTYRWYSANSTDPSNDLGYGLFGADGKYFTSPTTLPTGSGTVTYYYQREISNVVGGPAMSGFTSAGVQNGPNQGLYSLDYTSTADFELTEITLLIYVQNMDQSWYSNTHRIQVELDGVFSNWYDFNKNNVSKINGHYYSVTVPVDRDGLGNGLLGTAGTSTIQVYGTSGGNANAVTTLAFLNSTQLNNSYTIGTGSASITIDQDGNDQSDWFGTVRPAIFDWNVNFSCPLESISASEETNTSNCCTPVTTQPNLATQSGETVFESPFSATLQEGTGGAGQYYVWYLDGNQINQGVGLDEIPITSTGKYTVKVVNDAADEDKASCFNTSSIFQVKEKILFAEASASTICLGESVTLTANGSIGNTDWDPDAIIADPTAIVTTATPTAAGPVTFSVSALVPEGNLVENSDFEDGNTGFSFSAGIRNAPYADLSYTFQNLPAPLGSATHPTLTFANYGSSGNGVFTITDTYLAQNNWVLAPSCVDHTSGTGFFYLHDAMSSNTMTSYGVSSTSEAYIWSQDVVVEPNTDYDFSAWFANAATDQTNPPDIQFYIDDQPVGTLYDPAANTTDWGTCDWHEHTHTWNSGSTSGTVTLKIIETTHAGSGNDFMMDDVYFSSGNGTQTDEVTIQVDDCFDLTLAQLNACPATELELVATHNGYVDRWEDGSGTVQVGGDTLRVNPAVTTTYEVFVQYPLGNLVVNGDFELGNQGFSSDLNYGAGSVGPGGYGVGSDPSALNGFFFGISDHTSGSGNMGVFDAGSAAQTVWSTTVDVETGREYAFSVWIANINTAFLNPPELQFVINGIGLDIIDFPENTSDWFQFSETWTSTLTGNITIELVNANGMSSGNDFAMDDVVFAPLYNQEKSETIVVTPCCTAPGTTPTIAGGNQSICSNETQDFSATVQSGLFYQWQRGGVDISGASGQASGTTVTLNGQTIAGDYTIKVASSVANLAGCFDESAAVTLTVNDQPTDPTGSPVTVCVGDNLNVVASSTVGSGTVTYSWDGPGSNDGTGATFNVASSAALSQAGTYTVSATANGCPADNTADILVTINDVPGQPSFTTSQGTVCEGTSGVSYEIGAVATATGYTWNYTGTGATINGSGTSVTIDFAAGATNGNVEVTAFNGCGSGTTQTFAVTIDAPASFSTEPSETTICSGDDVIFTSMASGPGTTSYQWYGPSGILSNGGKFSGATTRLLTITGATAAEAGDYYVTFTANCGTITSATGELIINPLTAITVQPADDTKCETEDVTFTVTATGTAPLSYAWEFDGSTSVGTNSATLNLTNVTTSEAGTYGVTVTGGCGSPVNSNLATLTVNTAPSITAEPVAQGLCAGSDANFAVTATGTGPLGYQWQKNQADIGDGGNILGTSTNGLSITSIVSGDAGDYRAVVSNTCGTATSQEAALNITLTEFPSVTIAVDSSSVCEGRQVVFTATGNATGTDPQYTFFNNADNSVLQAASSSTTYTASGLTGDIEVYVSMLSNSGCIDGTATNPAVSTPESVTVVPMPADAIIDQSSQQTCEADFNLTAQGLDGNTTGTWSTDVGSVSTALGTSTTLNLPNPGDIGTITFTTSSGVECPEKSAQVTIERVGVMTTAQAGPAQTICVSGTAVMAANSSLQSNETGTWTLPAEATLVNRTLNDFNAEFEFSTDGTHTLTWTIDNGLCPISESDVVITVDPEPTTPIINEASQQICVADFDLTAQPFSASTTGTWSTDVGSVSSVTGEATTLTIPGAGQTAVVTLTTSTGTACSTPTAQVTIERVGDMTPPDAGLDQTVCVTETATLAANDNLQLNETGSWTLPAGVTLANRTINDRDAQVSFDVAGVYTLTWTVDNGVCPTLDATVDITVDAVPGNVALDAATLETCSGTINLNAQVPTPATAVGTWSVFSEPSAGLTSIDDVNDPTSSTDIESGQTVFLWSVENGECPATSVQLTVDKIGDITPPLITLSGGVFSGDDVSNGEVDLCANTSYTITGEEPNVGNGETGLWANVNSGTNASINYDDDFSQTLTLDEAGTQTILSWTIENPNPTCLPETRTLTINVFNAPDATISSVSGDDICEGETVTITTNPVNSYDVVDMSSSTATISGSSPSFTASNFAAGTNTVTWVVSNAGCPPMSTSTSIFMTENVTPEILLSTATGASVYCSTQGPAVVNAAYLHGGTNPIITWSVTETGETGSGTSLDVDITTPGTFTIEASLQSDETCVTQSSDNDVIQITSFSASDPQIIGDSTRICSTDGSIDILTTGTGSGTLQWYSTGQGLLIGENADRLEDVSAADTYWIVEDDPNCGEIPSNTFTLTVDDPPFVDAQDEVKVFVGAEETFEITTNAISIVWVDPPYFISDTASTEPTVAPLSSEDEASYELEVRGTTGACEVTTMALITVRTPVEVPNTFTPNGDDFNDVWEIRGISTYSDAIVRVYNRWGSLVYERYGGYDEPWDGSRSGKELPSATYYYVIDLGVEDINGQFHKGDVTIMR